MTNTLKDIDRILLLTRSSFVIMIGLIIFLIIYNVVCLINVGRIDPYDSICGPVTFFVLQYSKKQTTELTKLPTQPLITAPTNLSNVAKSAQVKTDASISTTEGNKEESCTATVTIER